MMRTLTPVLSIIIALLLFIFFTQPQYGDITVLQQSIDEYHLAGQKYDTFLNTLNTKLDEKKNQSIVANERLDVLVPNSIDDTRLLVDLEKVAKNNNMLFGNIETKTGDYEVDSATNEEVGNGLKELYAEDISFEVIGTYDQFKSFLSTIENSLTLFEVTEMSVTETENSAFQQFALTVRTFALPDNTK